MDKEYLKILVDEAETIDPQNEILEEENKDKRLIEMAKNLDETINYLDSCNQIELFWATEVLEELSEHFKSQKLIECIERNIYRFPDKELQEQLKMELEYMKLYV